MAFSFATARAGLGAGLGLGLAILVSGVPASSWAVDAGEPKPAAKPKSHECLIQSLGSLLVGSEAPVLPQAPRFQRANTSKVAKLSEDVQDQLTELGLKKDVVAIYAPGGPGLAATQGGAAAQRTGDFPRALRPPANAPPVVDPHDIRFMQDSISNFTQGKDYTVLQNALDLRSGKLKPADLPPIRIWLDDAGRVWTLDHRRLGSFLLAGNVDRIPVEWVGPSAVVRQEFKLTTIDDGGSTILKLGNGVGIQVRTGHR